MTGPLAATIAAAENIDTLITVQIDGQFIIMVCFQCLFALPTGQSRSGQNSVHHP